MLRTESKKFIEIQVRFAERLVELTNEPFNEVLAKHTVLRRILKLPYGDEIYNHPLWQEFVNGIVQQSDKAGWAYEFHLDHLSAPTKYQEPRFGCFVFDYSSRPVVRFHFWNPTNGSVLNRESVVIRQAEIKSLFGHVQQHHPEAEGVRGGSWLYNIDAYRRLFPPAYVETAKAVGNETGYFSLWGQFLRGDRSVREDRAEQFLASLAKQTTVEGCMGCFPYEVLRPECPIEVFYEFYSL